MISRRSLVFAAFFAVAFAAAPAAFAAERIDYTPEAFEAAAKAGRPILVHIRASWCPTCRAQAPILAKLVADPKYANLIVVNVDFDSQKDAVRRFGAQMQSTLIAFKGVVERARSVGDANPDSIAALVAKTL